MDSVPPQLLYCMTWPLHCALQVDLPTALSVDMIHCERQASLAMEQSKGDLQLIHGELIMQSYFDNLAAEVQETLQVRRRAPLPPSLHQTHGNVPMQCFPRPHSAAH